jgi:flagellar basal-body rod protein FlgG
MLRGLYAAVSGLRLQQQKQETAANNLVNLEAAGYKREQSMGKAFSQILLQEVNGERVQGKVTPGVTLDEVVTDFQRGNIVKTGRLLDFAITGRGFFTFRGDDGSDFYSRNGEFTVDENGFLVSSTGEKVIGVNAATGMIEAIELGEGELSISGGSLFLDQEKKYDLLIVDFADYKLLQKQGPNRFTVTGGQGRRRIDAPEVVHGNIEKSNVDINEEMVKMLEIQHKYQMDQRVVRFIDDTLQKAVNEVGSLR